MKIVSMHVQNYKTLENIIIPFAETFNSISGKNNAGKTSVITALRGVLKDKGKETFWFGNKDIEYSSSFTQWATAGTPITLTYVLKFSEAEDPGMYHFVIKIASLQNFDSREFLLKIELNHTESGQDAEVYINDTKLGTFESKEIYTKITGTSLALYYHSAEVGLSGLGVGGISRLTQDLMFTNEERADLTADQEKLKKKIKKMAGKNRTGLSDLLGKLEDKYDVELSIFEKYLSGHIPLEINLKDKSVDIPLSDWGTGTQNRTQVMMLILYANKIKEDLGGVNRITPIVIIEEPESFLHPSAQAEFGRVIRNLSRDLQIQIITSTHSPYMLCQEYPESNILLDRKLYRKSLRQTEIVPISENNWMYPFSQILGLANDSFSSWHAVIGAKKDCAIFVEGIIDKQYIEFIASLDVPGFSLPAGCEILSYEGKDALKNSILLKFVLEKFHKYLLTFDLDALSDLDRPMRNLGLERDKNFHTIGISEPGKDCIEGLLPGEIPASVYASNYSLVMKAQSQDPRDRKSAKNSLKTLMLDAFRKRSDWTKTDLAGFKPLFSNIAQAFKE